MWSLFHGGKKKFFISTSVNKSSFYHCSQGAIAKRTLSYTGVKEEFIFIAYIQRFAKYYYFVFIIIWTPDYKVIVQIVQATIIL